MIWLALIIFVLAAILSGVAISYVAGAAAVLAYVMSDHAAYLGILPQRIFGRDFRLCCGRCSGDDEHAGTGDDGEGISR